MEKKLNFEYVQGASVCNINRGLFAVLSADSLPTSLVVIMMVSGKP